MAEHSPGPWSLAVSADRTPLVVAPGRSTGVAIIPFQRDEVCRQARIEETGANARLIAAAPDMLAALQYALKSMRQERDARLRETTGTVGVHAIAIGMAEAAIAKAEGRSNG